MEAGPRRAPMGRGLTTGHWAWEVSRSWPEQGLQAGRFPGAGHPLYIQYLQPQPQSRGVLTASRLATLLGHSAPPLPAHIGDTVQSGKQVRVVQ